MSRIVSLGAGCLLALLLAGCKQGSAAPANGSPPPLPAATLAPKLAVFQDLARLAPAPPPTTELAKTKALLEPALLDLGDDRLRAKSHAALLADPLAGFALEAALEHEEASIRQNAAFELGGMDRPAALVPLLKRLKYELDPTVRVWVADALARRGCGSGVDVLLTALRVPETADVAGQRAVALLREDGEDVPERPTWEAIESGLSVMRGRWRRTGRLREGLPVVDDATRGRLGELMCALEGFQLRPVDDARFMLARAGQLALPLLRDAVVASEQYLRTHALEVVRDLGPVAAELAPAVLPLLRDALSRTDAAAALAAMRERTAVPYLLEWLDGPDPELRMVAARGLGLIGDPRALPALRAHMDDPKETMDVRVMSAFGVALFEVDRPAFRFLRELRDERAYHDPTLAELLDEVERRRGG